MSGTDYTTVADVKARLGTETVVKSDDVLGSVISAASRLVEHLCGDRRFYQEEHVAKVLTADGGILDVPDLVSVDEIAVDISGVRVYDTIWGTDDFDLNPADAAEYGFPYTSIQARPFTSRWFPTVRRGVRVTGTWGWPTVPDDIVEATILQAIRLFKRRDAPYGVAGMADFGPIAMPRIDPDVRMLCAPYVRHAVGAV